MSTPEETLDPVKPRSPHDAGVIEALDRILEDVGADPGTFDGQLIREAMQSCLKLVRDGADTGELKLVTRSLKELRYAMKIFRPYRDTDIISVFGSARTPEDHPNYASASDFSKNMAESGWMVITGAGDGIMKAGHDGAGREASFGVAIRLPFETTANTVIHGDDKLVTFRYFFTRKLMFVSQAKAVALFPGGFGTLDEAFEVMTLIQTGKSAMMPLVLVAAQGDDYWLKWEHYVTHELLGDGLISPEDVHLYFITDDPAEAAEHVRFFYSTYHSQRFVKDTFVLRLNKRLTDHHLARLNEEFADLVASGKIEQTDALEGESTYLDKPRLAFDYTKHHYGRQRLLIDRINEMGAEVGGKA